MLVHKLVDLMSGYRVIRDQSEVDNNATGSQPLPRIGRAFSPKRKIGQDVQTR
jgi:hypothetical protein